MRTLTTFLGCAIISVTGLSAHAGDAPRATVAPIIDGDSGDPAWAQADWHELRHLMLGSQPAADDFSGRYKVVWTPEFIYVLAEIVDDVLIDSHPDPLEFYWQDDTFEILIDEDASGGLHHFDYNAFAYHIALDNQVVDIGPYLSDEDREKEIPNIRTYPEHVQAAWKRSTTEPHRLYWEARVAVFGDDYKDRYATGEAPAQPVQLSAGKKLGFMVAYVDSDSPNGREHFMGDVDVAPVNGDRNLGYIDADVFGELTLIEHENQ